MKPTLQLADEKLYNIYAAGDVADSGGYGNSRSAMEQATIVANNILLGIQGKPLVEYKPSWFEDGIELTSVRIKACFISRAGRGTF